jgi:hypothetical protein
MLRALRAEADRVAGIAHRLRHAIETVTDRSAAEAEVEAVRTAAEQRTTAADAARAAAERRAAEAEAACAAAGADRDAAVEQARRDGAARVAAETERDAAIERARAKANEWISAAVGVRTEGGMARSADLQPALRVPRAGICRRQPSGPEEGDGVFAARRNEESAIRAFGAVPGGGRSVRPDPGRQWGGRAGRLP